MTRQELLQAIRANWFSTDEDMVDFIFDVLPELKEPPIRHGKWKNLKPCSPVFECTLCKYHNFIKSNYCPNCGARMDEEIKQ